MYMYIILNQVLCKRHITVVISIDEVIKRDFGGKEYSKEKKYYNKISGYILLINSLVYIYICFENIGSVYL